MDYINGFIDIVNIEIPRYSFISKKLDITYPNCNGPQSKTAWPTLSSIKKYLK